MLNAVIKYLHVGQIEIVFEWLVILLLIVMEIGLVSERKRSFSHLLDVWGSWSDKPQEGKCLTWIEHLHMCMCGGGGYVWGVWRERGRGLFPVRINSQMS